MRKPSKAKGRLACQHCSDRKKACHWPRQAGEDEACFRCSQSGLECVPQDTTISRRARERLRREQEIDYDEDEGSLGGSVDADSESASLAVPEDEREQVSATAAGRRKRTRDRADQSQPSNLAINIQNPKRQRRQDDSGPVPGRRKRAAESSATSSASPPVPGLSPANGSSEERSGPTDDVNGSPYFPLPPEVPDLVLSPTIESQKGETFLVTRCAPCHVFPLTRNSADCLVLRHYSHGSGSILVFRALRVPYHPSGNV